MRRVSILFAILTFASTGAARSESPAMLTGENLSRAGLRAWFPQVICGDDTYAIVNSAWLKSYAQTFRAELFRMTKGAARPSPQFDCNRFATLYIGVAQARYHAETWHASQAAANVALGHFWYKQPNGSVHAIVAAITERGRVFIEPQTGAEIELPYTQIAAPVLCLF
jgi:hypothetical protein